MLLDKVKWLHVEPSTRCNAWCPGCPRNKQGFGLADGLVVEDLSIERLKSVIESLPNLERVIFCGNLGDPCASKIINEQLNIVYQNKLYLQLQTNGSLRSKKWWQELAKKFQNNIEIWFALDGLEDTHSYYRQGTNYNKILDNATNFINAGGRAVWQFIPFEHNEHQIKDCLKLSQRLGFVEFRLIKDARYLKKSFHYRTGKEISMKTWSKQNETWKRKNNGLINTVQDPTYTKTKVEVTDCVHLAMPSIYLNARGVLSPCCMWGIRGGKLKDFNIQKNFDEKNWLSVCLRHCGS